MKRIHTLFLALVLTATAMADHVSQTDALQTAREFFASSLFSAKSNALGATTQTATVTLAGQDEGYYIYNREGGGYVVIAADDKARSQVLGYSFTGTLQADDMPLGLRDLLDTYNQELTLTTTASGLKLTDLPLLATTDDRQDVDTMIITKWGQRTPFNNLVITLEGNGPLTPTGCVATAMSQMMNYHQYPDRSTGTSTATLADGSEYTLELGDTTYDWDLIGGLVDTTSYTPEQADAVSKLSLDAGVAVNMMYEETSSAAYTYSLCKGLIKNFGYDRQLHQVPHELYTTAEWDELIYSELATGRPVIYNADAINGGHSFILDGYADGYYHVNWGWYGDSNGYFLLSALDPAHVSGARSAFIYNADAVVGIQPPVDGHTDYTGVFSYKVGGFTCTGGSGKTGSYAFADCDTDNPYTATITIVPALQVEDAEGNTTWRKCIQDTTITLGMLDYYTTHGTFSFADLSDGTYTLRQAYYDTADGEYHLIPVSYGTDYVGAQIAISGDELTYEAVTRGLNLTCNSFTSDTDDDTYYAGEEHTFTANVTNNGSTYVYTDAPMVLCDAETDIQVTSSWSISYVILEPGESMDVDFIIDMPEAGTYNVYLVDQDNTIFYSAGTLTVQPTPTAVDDIQAATPAPAATGLAIYDTQGRLLLRQHAAEPDLSSLPQGIYVVKTPDGTSKVVRK